MCGLSSADWQSATVKPIGPGVGCHVWSPINCCLLSGFGAFHHISMDLCWGYRMWIWPSCLSDDEMTGLRAPILSDVVQLWTLHNRANDIDEVNGHRDADPTAGVVALIREPGVDCRMVWSSSKHCVVFSKQSPYNLNKTFEISVGYFLATFELCGSSVFVKLCSFIPA